MRASHLIILFLFITSLSLSCKKETSSLQQDDIVYTEFNPEPELTSMDSLVFVWAGSQSYYQPYPVDSLTSYVLDINADSNPDFRLVVSNSYHFVSASGPQANYNFDMTITGINLHSEISTLASNISNAYFYDQNELINGSSSSWNGTARLWHSGGQSSSYYIDFTGTQYIGLRIKSGFSYNYAWLKINRNDAEHKLTIMSFGFNRTNGNSILAGQE